MLKRMRVVSVLFYFDQVVSAFVFCILSNSGNTLAYSPKLFCRRSHLTECYTSVREFGSFRPIIGVGRFVLGRAFRPRDVSDSL